MGFLNFPHPPSEGQVYWPGYGTSSFVHKSGKWVRQYGTALRRNRFVNPAFQVNEQNFLTDGSNVAGLTMAEQYYVYYSSDVGVYRGQRLISPTPRGSQHRLRVSITTADPAMVSTDWLALATPIEANRMVDFKYGTANGQYGVVRFGWRSPAGTYTFSVRGAGFTRSFLIPFTINAEQANTDREIVLILPPCLDGSWATDNSAWGWCYWMIANAATHATANAWLTSNWSAHSSQSNGFATVGNTFELFDVGFYLDPLKTGIPPEFETPLFEDDLMECQRHWYRMYGGRGIVDLTTKANYLTAPHPVPMRAIAASTLVGTLRVYDGNTAPNATTVGNAGGYNQATALQAITTGLVVGRMGGLLVDGQSASYVAQNARM